jgi:acyl carrier protein
MTVQSIAEIVIETLERTCHFQPHSVRIDTDLLELGVDSLSLVSVVNSVSLSFGIEVDGESMEKLLLAETVADFAAITENLMTEQS